ncbi:MAG TPA: metallophosphoesterase [Thermoanaerobaculia bacterium]|nr:metallophosphoesterase [Thermoanaerobaculia bacterium]
MRRFWRFIAVLLAWTAGWWLVIGALLHSLLPGGWLTVVGAAALCTAPILARIGILGREAYPSALKRLWLYRPFWYIQLFVPLLALAGLAGALAGSPFGASGPAGRGALALAALILAGLALAGYVGTHRLVVRRLEADFDDLPPGLEGMRIVQISDLHVGPHTSRRHLRRIAAAVRDARPDLIAITGDQVDDYAGDIEPFAAAFDGLSAPLGVFAIPGNHDVYAGWTAVHQGLEALGMTVLVNHAVPLERNGSRFWLAGTGDPAGRGGSAVAPDIPRTLAAIPPDSFTIALAHNPALWPALAERGVELTLSGHTHYGQLAIPRLGWSLASPFLKHAMGAHRQDGSLLYINPGTNYWGIPFRLGTRPEVTVLTLRRHPEVAPLPYGRSGAVAKSPKTTTLSVTAA